jgi:hypothetical protein
VGHLYFLSLVCQNAFQLQDLLDLWGTLDAETLGPWTRTESMDKSRKLGWNGFVDTKESIREVIGQLAELKLVHKLR